MLRILYAPRFSDDAVALLAGKVDLDRRTSALVDDPTQGVILEQKVAGVTTVWHFFTPPWGFADSTAGLVFSGNSP